MTGRHDMQLYPNSERQWYYCYADITTNGLYRPGCWRHISKIKNLIIGDIFLVGERFNKITLHIYTDDQLEMVVLSEELEQDFTYYRLMN